MTTSRLSPAEIQTRRDNPPTYTIDLAPGSVLELPTEDRYGDTLTIDEDAVHIRFHCKYTRHTETLGFAVTPEGRSARQVYQGPKIDGPFGGTFAMPTVISAYPSRRPTLTVHAQEGSRFRLASQVYELRDDRPRDYPRLVAITDHSV